MGEKSHSSDLGEIPHFEHAGDVELVKDGGHYVELRHRVF